MGQILIGNKQRQTVWSIWLFANNHGPLRCTPAGITMLNLSQGWSNPWDDSQFYPTFSAIVRTYGSKHIDVFASLNPHPASPCSFQPKGKVSGAKGPNGIRSCSLAQVVMKFHDVFWRVCFRLSDFDDDHDDDDDDDDESLQCFSAHSAWHHVLPCFGGLHEPHNITSQVRGCELWQVSGSGNVLTLGEDWSSWDHLRSQFVSDSWCGWLNLVGCPIKWIIHDKNWPIFGLTLEMIWGSARPSSCSWWVMLTVFGSWNCLDDQTLRTCEHFMRVPGNLLVCVWSSISFQTPKFRLSNHQIPRLAHGDRRNLHGSVSRFQLGMIQKIKICRAKSDWISDWIQQI